MGLEHQADDVTVVVMSRNRRKELLHTLTRHEAPVVLVDNASTDGTADAVEETLPHVDVVRLDRNVGSVARTLGVERARTGLVAFADDDSWWAPGALADGADLMRRHPRVALLAARILVGAAEREDPMCAEMAASPLGTAPDLPGPSLLGFVACAAMVRRDAFLEAGGFDDVVVFPGEEARPAIDLAAAGRGLAYCAELVVHHHPSVLRDADGRRQAELVRSRLLTALMRRPWPVVARDVRAALASGRMGRAGAAGALTRMPSALAARRPAPEHVEAGLRVLEAARAERRAAERSATTRLSARTPPRPPAGSPVAAIPATPGPAPHTPPLPRP